MAPHTQIHCSVRQLNKCGENKTEKFNNERKIPKKSYSWKWKWKNSIIDIFVFPVFITKINVYIAIS